MRLQASLVGARFLQGLLLRVFLLQRVVVQRVVTQSITIINFCRRPLNIRHTERMLSGAATGAPLEAR